MSACSTDNDRAPVRTRQRLRVIDTIITDEFKRTTIYPKDIQELQALVNKRAEQYGSLLIDDFGYPIRYVVVKNGYPLIYSIGRNGIDENGGGDDIAIRIKP